MASCDHLPVSISTLVVPRRAISIGARRASSCLVVPRRASSCLVVPPGMDEMDNLQQKRVRISWKDNNVVKTFLEACIQETTLNGAQGGGLKPLSWIKVAETLKNTHGFVVDRKQMKIYLDYLKGKYGAWVKLKNKTGNIYDASTNMFNLTAEEWELEAKTNKYIDKLRKTTLSFPDLCAKLFDGSVASGVDGWGPSSTISVSSVNPRVDMLVDEDEDEAHDSPPIFNTEDNLSRSQEKKKKRKEMDSTIDTEIMSVLKIMSEKYKAPEKSEPHSFDDCLTILDSLGWASDYPLYNVALAIISDEKGGYREAWMKLKPERRENWVRMIGRTKGLM